MNNNLLLVIEIITCFVLLLISKKLFGKTGIFVWVAVAALLANVVQAKNATILGLNAGIGHVLFSSTFLATDILTECYSEKEARKAIWIGLLSNVVYVIAMLIALGYKASPIDIMAEPMAKMFGLNIRITAASMVMYLISNHLDVFIFSKLKKATGGKYMWLRNNVATIICNCGENFGFAFLAFGGVYTVKDILGIAIASTAVEVIIGLLDTPFLYMAKAMKKSVFE